MKKQKMIDFIDQVNERFENARNHGSGNNWWYPKPNRIAYNVKLHGASMNVEDIRKHMTARQNDYYSDDALYEICDEEQVMRATQFSDEIDKTYGVESGYAGRSGGWLEVTYSNPIGNYDLSDAEQVKDAYAEAKELDALESKVAGHIEKAHAKYQKYLNTEEYCTDIVNILLDDEMIAGTYKGKIKNLTDKLQ